MPKSKRNTLVSLTKVKPDRKDLKARLITSVRESAEAYSSAYAFSFENQRAMPLKALRTQWSDSRFVIGKNRLMQLALGETPEDAHRPDLDKLAGDLHGQVGLLFTDRPHKEVTAFFNGFSFRDFARAGFVPESTIQVPPGRLTDMPHTMLDTLRKLGMPCNLDRGVIVLPQSYTLCHAGKPVTPEQGRLLKHFGHQLAEFKILLLSTVSSGTYKPLLSLEILQKDYRKDVRPKSRGGGVVAGKKNGVEIDDDMGGDEEDEEEGGGEEEEEEEEMEEEEAPKARGKKSKTK